MTWLTSLPGPVLLVGSLTIWVLFAFGVNRWLHARNRDDSGERAGLVAAAYMTALGSLFAILTGFLINSEYATLRQTQSLVAAESAAASQLAYSTEGLPAADVERIQDRLVEYLDATERDEWRALGSREPENSRAFAALKELKSAVFYVSTEPFAPAPAVDSMREAVNSLTSVRRERVAVASQELPIALLALSVLAGVALIANALIVTLRAGPRYTLVAWGIVVIVALDIAAILAIAGPFRGPFQATRDPITSLSTELKDGRFIPWLPGDAAGAPNAASVECVDAEAVATSSATAGRDRSSCLEVGVGEPLTVGVLAWLSGASSAGDDALLGSTAAVDYLDGRFDGLPGQLLGHAVELAVVDDGCSADVGSRAATQVAGETDLVGVVGTTCSSAALGAADKVLSDQKILLVSPANTSPALTSDLQHSRYYFRTIFNDLIQGSVVADFAAQQPGTLSAAVVSDGNSYSEGLADIFGREVQRAGGGKVTRLTTTSGSTDPSREGALPPDAVVDQLVATQPSLVFLPMFDPRCTELVKGIRDRPELAQTTVVVSEACQSTDLLKVLGPAADGVLASGPDVADLAESSFYRDSFRPAIERQTGRAPTGIYHAYAFDATNLLFGAVRRAAVRLPGGALRINRAALRSAMLEVKGYPGVTGQLTCQPSGECAQGARIAMYEAPNWPVAGPVAGQGVPTPVFSQNKTLVEVLGAN